MKLARYWTRQEGESLGPGGAIRVTARGWSDTSLDDARRRAREIAQRLAARLAAGQDRGKQYLYGDRPLPEPVIQEVAGGAGIITRNMYGALVMNTRDMMFVDVDRSDAPPSRPSGGILEGIMSLFGKPAPEPDRPPSNPVAEEIRAVAQRNRLAGRVYQTAAGYRAIITSAVFDPASSEADGLLRQFGSDPLYIRLCKLQESFRARLTPKPWRCGFHAPPVEFPYETPRAESEMGQWVKKYGEKSDGYATCRFLFAFGDADRRFEEPIRHHDRETRAQSGLPLA